MAFPKQTVLTDIKQFKLTPEAASAVDSLIGADQFPSRSAVVDHAIRVLTGLPPIDYLKISSTRTY